MITKYGMSEQIGPAFHADTKAASSDTQAMIDAEVRSIVIAADLRARKVGAVAYLVELPLCDVI